MDRPAASGSCFSRMDTTFTSLRLLACHSACPRTAPPTGTWPPGDLLASCRCQASSRHPWSLQGSWPPSLPTWVPRTP
eukprot:bmy_06415T0